MSSSLLSLLRELVWKSGHWKTAALKDFVNEFNPDIIFIPIYPTVYMGWIQKYIIKLARKPTVCYLADDNYSYDSYLESIIYEIYLVHHIIIKGSYSIYRYVDNSFIATIIVIMITALFSIVLQAISKIISIKIQ